MKTLAPISARQCYWYDEEAGFNQIIYFKFLTSLCIDLQSTAQNLLQCVSHLQKASSQKSIKYPVADPDKILTEFLVKKT